MTTQIWGNIGSGNGLVPDGIKTLPESNVDLSSIIHLGANSQKIPQPSIAKSSLRITYLNCHSNLPLNNELTNISEILNKVHSFRSRRWIWKYRLQGGGHFAGFATVWSNYILGAPHMNWILLNLQYIMGSLDWWEQFSPFFINNWQSRQFACRWGCARRLWSSLSAEVILEQTEAVLCVNTDAMKRTPSWSEMFNNIE